MFVTIKFLNNYTCMNVQFIFTFFHIDELLSDCNNVLSAKILLNQ